VFVSTKRRKFSAQYKAEAVQLVVQSGRSVTDVAGELGLVDQTLGNWVIAWRREQEESGPAPESTVSGRARLAELEDENRRLRMENEFLKKAAAFFARTQD
jgi:transposase-like protein